ncbi:hypothetical protein U5640_06960 [Streptomyces sp. SS7]|uniref:hypothetical protein n=1 Tax=Streptomyces sp. SS7 TaxID=3108485 RepID=UPI0030EF893E
MNAIIVGGGALVAAILLAVLLVSRLFRKVEQGKALIVSKLRKVDVTFTGQHPARAGRFGPARRSGRRASRAQWPRPGPGQVRRRSGAQRPDLQGRQGLRGQGSYPADQPAQGRPGHR